MTMAQFSRDDILIYQGREEGREQGREEGREQGMREGEIKGVIQTYKNLGVSMEDAKRYIMDKLYKSEEETDRYMNKYWK